MTATYNTLAMRRGAGDLVEKVLADTGDGRTPFWGIRGMTVSYRSMDSDACEFDTQGGNFDDDPDFLTGDVCQVYLGRVKDQASPTGFSGGTRVFYGRVLTDPRAAAGKAESVRYTLAGPWWWLENQTYVQDYKVFAGYRTPGDPSSGVVYATTETGHVFLNRTIQLAWLCTGEQIQDAVAKAVAAGAPIQLLPDQATHINAGSGIGFADRTVHVSGGIQTLVDIPIDEVVDVTDAEAIKKQARWTPDCVCWFDYTTDPFPTFRLARRAQLNPASVAVLSGRYQATQVRARTDMQRQYVKLNFEILNDVNGQQWLDVVQQTWPSPLGALDNSFGGMVATIRIPGAQLKTTSVTVKTLPVPDGNVNSTSQRATIALFHPWLADRSAVASFDILEYGRGLSLPLGYFLAPGSGQVTDWLTSAGVDEPAYVNDTFVFRVRVVGTNGDVEEKVLDCQVVSTNIDTGGAPVVFTKKSGLPYSEPVPPGLAKVMFDALNPICYSGSLSWVGDDGECDTGTVGMGDSISFSDVPRYAAMAMQVKEVTLDVDKGRKTVSFGPANILSVGDYVELLRVTRPRILLTDPNSRNASIDPSSTSVGVNTAAAMAAGGGGYKSLHVVSDNPDGTGGNVLADGSGRFGVAGLGGGPAILIQRGRDGAGDKAILMAYIDVGDVQQPDDDGYFVRLRWYQVCVLDPETGQQTVMKAKLLGSLPQALLP